MNGLDANDATNAFVKVKDIMFEPIELLFDCNKGTCDSCTCCHDRFVSEVRLCTEYGGETKTGKIHD